MAFLADVDKLKLDKIKEKAETVELTGKSAAPKPAKSASAPKPAKGPQIVKPSENKSAKPAAGSEPNKKVVRPGAGGGGSAKPKKANGGSKPASAKSTAALTGGVTSEPDTPSTASRKAWPRPTLPSGPRQYRYTTAY